MYIYSSAGIFALASQLHFEKKMIYSKYLNNTHAPICILVIHSIMDLPFCLYILNG